MGRLRTLHDMECPDQDIELKNNSYYRVTLFPILTDLMVSSGSHSQSHMSTNEAGVTLTTNMPISCCWPGGPLILIEDYELYSGPHKNG